MPITINGTGSITGVTAGGLPSGSVTTANIADANITAAKLNGAQSGSAPIYGARAWVNFNGVGTVSVRGHGNVSSISDNGFGNYAVNFITAMPDTNYAVVAMTEPSTVSGVGATYYTVIGSSSTTVFTRTTSSAQICTAYISSTSGGSTLWDSEVVHVAIFR